MVSGQNIDPNVKDDLWSGRNPRSPAAWQSQAGR
jgi:hypothetical protein